MSYFSDPVAQGIAADAQEGCRTRDIPPCGRSRALFRAISSIFHKIGHVSSVVHPDAGYVRPRSAHFWPCSTARSMLFFNSVRLPGQSCSTSLTRASAVRRGRSQPCDCAAKRAKTLRQSAGRRSCALPGPEPQSSQLECGTKDPARNPPARARLSLLVARTQEGASGAVIVANKCVCASGERASTFGVTGSCRHAGPRPDPDERRIFCNRLASGGRDLPLAVSKTACATVALPEPRGPDTSTAAGMALSEAGATRRNAARKSTAAEDLPRMRSAPAFRPGGWCHSSMKIGRDGGNRGQGRRFRQEIPRTTFHCFNGNANIAMSGHHHDLQNSGARDWIHPSKSSPLSRPRRTSRTSQSGLVTAHHRHGGLWYQQQSPPKTPAVPYK